MIIKKKSNTTIDHIAFWKNVNEDWRDFFWKKEWMTSATPAESARMTTKYIRGF